MGFTNSEQLRQLYLSGGMGFLLGLYYDVFRVWRKSGHSSTVSVFFQDCFYFVTSAAIVFLFSLAMTDGVVRTYVLLGITFGFFAYRYTVGNILLRAVGVLVRWFHRLSEWIYHILAVAFGGIRTCFFGVCGKVWKFCRKIAKKSKVFFKKVLQRKPSL